ncbi:MAG: holo-ACP synthase, partial [Candidatus Omnitrophica bacterium]|nr:holo-ACP synthase [Candidatus Omnitrophota bacterium]
MVIGTGVDITEVSRLRRAVEKWGDSFLSRIFTGDEIKHARATRTKASFYQHLAGRFAAKEAVFKALGDQELTWQDVFIHNDRFGKPCVDILNGRGRNRDIHVSI